jgi:Rab-like protein 2
MSDGGPPGNDRPGDVKVILLGDSAVGKSKLVERYLMNAYRPQQLSTFALTLFRHVVTVPGKGDVLVDFWDTAGQERFNSMHPSYYHLAHACLLCFDVTRKPTYKHLEDWYTELTMHRPGLPVIVCANKIDLDLKAAKRSYAFAEKRNLPIKFVSASDGTNVVAAFEEIVRLAVQFKESGPQDFIAEVLELINEGEFLSDAATLEKPNEGNGDDGPTDEAKDPGDE